MRMGSNRLADRLKTFSSKERENLQLISQEVALKRAVTCKPVDTCFDAIFLYYHSLRSALCLPFLLVHLSPTFRLCKPGSPTLNFSMLLQNHLNNHSLRAQPPTRACTNTPGVCVLV